MALAYRNARNNVAPPDLIFFCTENKQALLPLSLGHVLFLTMLLQEARVPPPYGINPLN